ncbi:expansin-B15-like [Cynara cardunculus var. scolymus]|uniref:expansin-B15-like n=1 Tax=Cynara cardunculus var. scolymus TaxID=59895 RepID=UPI000D62479D|nr:expansin-B15-like [Cynara cardunculus var. scolymus]
MVSTPFIIITIFLAYFSSCLCVVLHNNNTFGLKDFEPALATWYGDETGAGSGRGACGWEDDVKDPPLSSMISAGNANIFLNGKGCGHCFQIFCNQPPYCSGEPIKVTVSDECPGACNNVPFHFDLSGFAFGAMALPGQDHNLRQLGQVDVQFQSETSIISCDRVPCNYGGTRITFKVHEDCNPYWFATAIEYADGDGGFGSIEIAAGGSQNFVGMDNIWGAVWKKDIDPSFIGPFSFRLTSVDGKTVVATNVIPATFSPGSKYSSSVNF